MSSGAKIAVLVVEDDENMADAIVHVLKEEGHAPSLAPTLAKARKILEKLRPGLIVLDRRLPDGDGADLCREIRQKDEFQSVPVIFLSAKDSVTDKVLGLKLGGDDYLAKPFAAEELAARVAALLRRQAKAAEPETEIRLGELLVKADERLAFLGKERIELTPREFDLLRALAGNKNRLLTREQLLTTVWGYERSADVFSKTVDVTLSRLKNKLGAWASRITAVAGYGYRLEWKE